MKRISAEFPLALFSIPLFLVAIVFGCASVTSNNPSERVEALSNVSDQSTLAKVALEDTSWYVRKAAVERLTDQSVLAKVALEDSVYNMRGAAVRRLTDQSALAKVALEDTSWYVRRAAINKLDKESLAALAKETRDPAVALVAKVILGISHWGQVLQEGYEENWLGDVLGAMALVDRPQPAPETIVVACHGYIRQGNESHIPELVELLFRYGDKRLAEDFLNCGKSELGAAAKKWAKERGYAIHIGEGYGRVRWGSER